MAKSIEQVAANLAAAVESGSSQDSASAISDYNEYVSEQDPEDVPAADNGPAKAYLDPADAPDDES